MNHTSKLKQNLMVGNFYCCLLQKEKQYFSSSSETNKSLIECCLRLLCAINLHFSGGSSKDLYAGPRLNVHSIVSEPRFTALSVQSTNEV